MVGVPCRRAVFRVDLAEVINTNTVPEFVIQVSQQATVNAELRVGDVSQQVNVTAAPVVVEHESALSTPPSMKNHQ